MAQSLFENSNFENILSRIDSLTVQSHPLWGKMNATQMLGHLDKAIGSALQSENTNTSFDIKRLLLANPIGRGLMFAMPQWPKNLPAPLEYIIGDNTEYMANLQRCKDKLILLKSYSKPLGEHPVFGKMDKKEWGQLLYKHIDHHLKQFGV